MGNPTLYDGIGDQDLLNLPLYSLLGRNPVAGCWLADNLLRTNFCLTPYTSAWTFVVLTEMKVSVNLMVNHPLLLENRLSWFPWYHTLMAHYSTGRLFFSRHVSFLKHRWLLGFGE